MQVLMAAEKKRRGEWGKPSRIVHILSAEAGGLGGGRESHSQILELVQFSRHGKTGIPLSFKIIFLLKDNFLNH